MIETLGALTRERWSDLYPGTDIPYAFHYVLQSRNRIILFLFAKGSDANQLVAVVKISRAPNDNVKLERGVEQMQMVRSLLTGSVQRTVPKTFLLGRINGLACSVEQAISGEPMEIARSRWRLDTKTARSVRAFSDWLVSFQYQMQTGYGRLDHSSISKLLATSKAHLNGPSIPERVTALLSHLEYSTPALQLPLTWRVGDCHHSNILLSDGQVSGVVDWDGAQPGQWPIYDWFQFVFEYAQEYSKKLRPTRTHEENTDLALRMLIKAPDDAVAAVLQKETSRFLATYDLPASLFPILFILFLDGFWYPHGKPTLVKQALTLLGTEWPDRC